MVQHVYVSCIFAESSNKKYQFAFCVASTHTQTQSYYIPVQEISLMSKTVVSNVDAMSQRLEENLSEAESGEESEEVSFDMDIFGTGVVAVKGATTEAAGSPPPPARQSRKKKADPSAAAGDTGTNKAAKTAPKETAPAAAKIKRAAATVAKQKKQVAGASASEENADDIDITPEDVQQTLLLIEKARQTSGQVADDLDFNDNDFVPELYVSKSEEASSAASAKTPVAKGKGAKAITPAAPRKRRPAVGAAAATDAPSPAVIRELFPSAGGSVTAGASQDSGRNAVSCEQLANLAGRVEGLERILGFALSNCTRINNGGGDACEVHIAKPVVKVEAVAKPAGNIASTTQKEATTTPVNAKAKAPAAKAKRAAPAAATKNTPAKKTKVSNPPASAKPAAAASSSKKGSSKAAGPPIHTDVVEPIDGPEDSENSCGEEVGEEDMSNS